jgi:hypothetical protein
MEEIMEDTPNVKDSGIREKMNTGSQRDTRKDKGRYDLLSAYALRQIALVAEQGAFKYDPNNWRLGQPVSRYIDSASRHLQDYLAGLRDELHLAQAAWNCMSAIETIKRCEIGQLPKELNDLEDIAWKMTPEQFNDIKEKQTENNKEEYGPFARCKCGHVKHLHQNAMRDKNINCQSEHCNCKEFQPVEDSVEENKTEEMLDLQKTKTPKVANKLKINFPTKYSPNDRCICGHKYENHQLAFSMCNFCSCKMFKKKEDKK